MMKPIKVADRPNSSLRNTGTKLLKIGQIRLMPKKPRPSRNVLPKGKRRGIAELLVWLIFNFQPVIGIQAGQKFPVKIGQRGGGQQVRSPSPGAKQGLLPPPASQA